MKRFADLYINPPLNEEKTLEQMADLLRMLGFSLVGIVFERKNTEDQISKITRKFNEYGIDVARRLELSPRTRIELLKDLRKFRGRFEIISVKCTNAQVSIVAARDRRVDLISIGRNTSIRNARRAINRIVDKSLEIKISEILFTTVPRTAILRRLHEEVLFAKKKKVTIVISSGAKNSMMLRSPRDLVALGVLLELENDDALKSVSKNPLSIVEKNREKLSTKWVAEGVKIVRAPRK